MTRKRKTIRTFAQAEVAVARDIANYGGGANRFRLILGVFEMGPLYTRHDAFAYQAWGRAAYRFHPGTFPQYGPAVFAPWTPTKLADGTWE